MRKCEKCGRSLEGNEKKLCPACQSTKSHQKKRWVEVIVGVIFVKALKELLWRLILGRDGEKK
ncbi:MAG: hypothetical protein JRJ38_10450 [Deltaproteobacteria bacterium]|nr:hypothetical protein [Deltaproteobacteria bacterium]